MLAAEDRILGHGEDVVLVLVVAVGALCDGVVNHEPVVHICILKISGLLRAALVSVLTGHGGARHCRM